MGGVRQRVQLRLLAPLSTVSRLPPAACWRQRGRQAITLDKIMM